MDSKTLRQVDEWLRELEDAAALRPATEFNPDTTTERHTAQAVGRWQGVQDARAWVRLKAQEHKPEE